MIEIIIMSVFIVIAIVLLLIEVSNIQRRDQEIFECEKIKRDWEADI